MPIYISYPYGAWERLECKEIWHVGHSSDFVKCWILKDGNSPSENVFL